ncbi:MAG: ParA family protein [Candidatus Hodarchaeales archaeon]|jgi:MinD-like ATPase involved in chromosome partitioning or flagellar assembly
MEKILVHSYKGGTGKTTVAVNIASLLSHDSKILLIENDFMMPSFFDIFKREPDVYFNDYFNGDVNFDELIESEVKSNLDVIFTNKNFDPNEKIMSSDQGWFLTILKQMMEDFKKIEENYDYVIFDTPPGWHLIVVNLIALSNKAILLLRPTSYEVNGTKLMLEILYRRAKPMSSWDVYLLFNQVPEVDMSTDLEKWAGEFKEDGIKYSGYISCSCNTAYEMAHDTKIFTLEHEFTQALQNALRILLETC